jgi:hypothetical protein
MAIRIATAICLVLVPSLATAQPATTAIELRSDLIATGLTLAETVKPVYGVRLVADVDKKGEGSGTLELDVNVPVYNELGFRTDNAPLPPMQFRCNVTFVKNVKLMLPEGPRLGADLVEVEWVLFRITGPKITSRLALSRQEKERQAAALLVQDKDGKVRQVIGVSTPPPQIPCHPGCFPAGTEIQTPAGKKRIEALRQGDVVTVITADGTASSAKIASVFTTTNRLLEVRTDAGTLVATLTQPLVLADGTTRAAGELKAGDRIDRWEGDKRVAVTVKEITLTGREAQVFNLILGDPVHFVANGYLVRSKPPALGAAAVVLPKLRSAP